MRALPTCSHYTLFRFEIDQITAYLDILTEHLLKTNDVSGKRFILRMLILNCLGQHCCFYI